MSSRSGSDHMISWLVLVFLLLALCIGLAGYRYYDAQQLLVKKNIQDELSAIADMKVNQIAVWRREQINDADLIFAAPFIKPNIRAWLRTKSPQLGEDILSWMRRLQTVHHYKAVLLLDPKGTVQLATPSGSGGIGPDGIGLAREAMASNKIILSDLYQSKIVPETRFSLLVPLIISHDRESLPVAVLLIRINPQEFLYPLIQSWPGTGKTAETLLIRRDGDEIVYLNELRHRKNTALTLRLPIDMKHLPAAMAIQGNSGVFEGLDYRDVPVLAATRAVPDSPWYLVAKVDRDEIYAPVRERARNTAFIVGILILTAGLSIILWWRKKSSDFLLKQYALEHERATLSQRYDYISKFANDIILLVDPAGNIVEANDRAATAYGYTRDELLRLTLRDIRPPETLHDIASQMEQVRESDGLLFETLHKRKDGTSFPVEISSRIIEVEGKRCFQSIIRDITERKQAETRLKERNTFIEAIINNLPIGLAVNTINDGKAIYMNSKFAEIYGWPKDVLVDVESFFAHVYQDPAYRTEIKEMILSDIAGGDPSRMHWDNILITTQTGETKFIAAVNIPLFEQGLMISTVLDMTSRKQAERALTESRQRYKRLVESVTDYIYTVTVENGNAVRTVHGPGCVTVTGYTPEEYQTDPDLWYRMVFEEDRKAVIEQTRRILAGAPVAPFEHRIIHKDGAIRWVRNLPVPRYDTEGRMVAYDGMITNITQLKLLENQLRQAQKMEAVGQLSGGIAHDFNNILTAIIGYAHLLLMKMQMNDPTRAYVDQILSSSDRAAHLTRSLLAFSRKQIIDLRPVNLNDIVTRVGKLLIRVIGEDIAFETRLTDGELLISADSVQIEQVFMNFATNARDAMPDGGTLVIETAPMELGEDFIRTHSYGTPGIYAYISVTDNGIGMDEKTRARIFEPFFTTKEVGKGTGLGLSMVYGIIKQHNGFINVYSEPGKGTTFKIYLPLIPSGQRETPAQEPVAINRGTETVLLAEDNEQVRNLTAKVLEDFGYTVIEAVDGEEAVRKFAENKDAVDLLVLDIIMPKKNGKEAYQDIKAVRPGIKALFMSGYTEDLIHKKGILDIGLDFVLKPITPSEFLKKVRDVLDRK